jgi:hypothetical protein
MVSRMGWEAAKQETIMASKEMALLMLLSIGLAHAAPPQLERPSSVPAVQVRQTAVAARRETSPTRKAEMTRRLFWLAMSLR